MSTDTVTQQTVPTGTWTADPVHSSARFEIGHSGVATFRGGFSTIEAKLEGGEKPRLTGAVKAEEIEIGEPQLKGHLLSPDFFDAKNSPRVRFTSTELRIADDGEVQLKGELEIRAETREVEARGRLSYIAEDLGGQERIGLSLESAIDRSDYGLNWQAELPSGGQALAYEVKLNVELELTREAA